MRDLELLDALHVAGRMRDWDRRCISALAGPVSDEEFAVNRWQTAGPAWSMWHDGEPVMIGGIELRNAWVAVFWMFAVEGVTPRGWACLMRHTRKVLANATNPAHEHYRHRVEAYTLGGWAGAEDLAKRFGFEHESVKRGGGSGGEDLNVWAIVGPVKGSE